MRYPFLFILWFLSAQVFAQQDRPIGANLTDLSPFGTLWFYTNCLKQSSGWLVRNANDENDPINGSSELTSELSDAFDADGYPLQVPFQYNHPETAGKDLEVMSFVLTNQPEPYLYPSGNYLLVFEGQGTLIIQGDVDGGFLQFSEAGSHLVPISNPSTNGLQLIITESSQSNPITNVQLIFPEYTSSYQQVKFRNDALELISNFDVLRFMKPLRVENNTAQEWAERPRSTNFSYFLDVENQAQKGMPYEDIVELSNLTGIHPWICVPHMANDQYVIQLAGLFQNQLNQDLRVYLEYSNETWNPSYPEKWQYMLDQGNALNLGTHEHPDVAQLEAIHRYATLRSLEIFQIFRDVYNDDSRYVSVLGSQSDPFIADLVFEALNLPQVNPHNIHPDAVAIASYAGVTMFDDFEANNLQVCDHSAADLLDSLMARVVPELHMQLDRWSQLTQQNGIELFAYEGGQHVTELNFQPMDPCAQELVAEMNSLPKMEDFFCSLLNEWYEELNGDLFMIFNLAERPDPFGAFGLLESQWQETQSSSKWRGVETCAFQVSILGSKEIEDELILYPNPANKLIFIQSPYEAPIKVEIIGLNGEQLRSFEITSGEGIELTNLMTGYYVVRIVQEQTLLIRKLLIVN